MSGFELVCHTDEEFKPDSRPIKSSERIFIYFSDYVPYAPSCLSRSVSVSRPSPVNDTI